MINRFFVFALVATLASSAHGFNTRVHILLANRVHQELVLSKNGSVPMLGTNARLVLPPDTVRIIRENLIYFRAGSIGPDNTIFPLLTDASHALGYLPFEQCSALVSMAITDEEKAYALGCFLHGSTDAVAHHFVNYLSGETFTLAPVSAGRTPNYNNVVRHIAAEMMIQLGAWQADREIFDASKMLHVIPTSFVQRAYFDLKSPIWQVVAQGARNKLSAARAQNPNLPLHQLLLRAPIEAYEHVLLLPEYLDDVKILLPKARIAISDEIIRLQSRNNADGALLKVTAGNDGKLGTKDDDIGCNAVTSSKCASLYARYFVAVGLMAKRFDAGGRELATAYDVIYEGVTKQLEDFTPALLQTVANLSNKFNEPVSPTMAPTLSITPSELTSIFTPLEQWAVRATAIDYHALTIELLPDWFNEIDQALEAAGIHLNIDELIQEAIEPYVAPIRQALIDFVFKTVHAKVVDFLNEYQLTLPPVEAEYLARTNAAAPPNLSGNILLDHFFETGLFMHAFNFASVALADEKMVLPTVFGEFNTGIASFDTSYSPLWAQPYQCEYLRPTVFPFGADVAGLLTVQNNQGTYRAQVTDDSPIECHDGSLTAFATKPSVANCMNTSFTALIQMQWPRGSITRGYPPQFHSAQPPCLRISLMGLSPPPEIIDSGVDAGTDNTGGGTGNDNDGGQEPNIDGGAPSTDGGSNGTVNQHPTSGCGGCSSTGAAAPLLALLGFLSLPRRRPKTTPGPRLWRTPASLALGLALVLSACGAPGPADDDGGITAVGGGSASTGGGAAGGTALGGGGGTSEMMGGGSGALGGGSGTGGSGGGGNASGGGAGGGGVDNTLRDALIEALHGTVWHGAQSRTERIAGIDKPMTRAYQLEFQSRLGLVGELRNPWGPGRARRMFNVKFRPDGITGDATVFAPQGWPTPSTNGEKYVLGFVIVPAAPPQQPVRKLRIIIGGGEEVYEEGPLPPPTRGLLAEARAFNGTTAMYKSFCGLNSGDEPGYSTLFSFARGGLDTHALESPIARDYVVGAPLDPWGDSTTNNFGITDVTGFGGTPFPFDSYGPTLMTTHFNFVVRFFGFIDHPGGDIWIREKDDDFGLNDNTGVWAFIGETAVGTDKMTFEAHSLAFVSDKTNDEEKVTLPAGRVPFEVILIRCGTSFENIHMQLGVGSKTWKLVSEQPTLSDYPPALFLPLF